METLIIVLGGLIIGAAALRLLVWSFKTVYKASPFIIIWIVILTLMYSFEINYKPEKKDTNIFIKPWLIFIRLDPPMRHLCQGVNHLGHFYSLLKNRKV